MPSADEACDFFSRVWEPEAEVVKEEEDKPEPEEGEEETVRNFLSTNLFGAIAPPHPPP